MCYRGGMEVVGLRELRQGASDLIRRVEAGEEIAITVAGRPAARLIPAASRTWRSWLDVAGLFAGPGDPAWATDRDEIADNVRDPWGSR
jgi:prevent-host-death family protein